MFTVMLPSLFLAVGVHDADEVHGPNPRLSQEGGFPKTRCAPSGWCIPLLVLGDNCLAFAVCVRVLSLGGQHDGMFGCQDVGSKVAKAMIQAKVPAEVVDRGLVRIELCAYHCVRALIC